MKKPVTDNPDFISMATAQTIPALFALRVKQSNNKIAYRQYVASSNTWLDYHWGDLYQQVCRWRQAMQREDLAPGDRVAVMLSNSVEWVCFDQAAQSLGLVVISLYTTDTADNIAYILADAGVRLLLVNEIQSWQMLDNDPSLDSLQRVWCLHEIKDQAPAQDSRLRYITEVLPVTAPDYVTNEINPDALATIIYTSGTTGRPKGVMLSHHNLLANAEAVQQRIPAYPDDVFLSFLPMAHGFERTVEYILPMMAGSCVTYARSVSLLKDDLVIVRPTVFISAPRLYEKIYVAIQQKIATSWLKRRLFDWTVALGWRQFLARQQHGPALTGIQQLLHKLLQMLVAKKVTSKLGGRLRVAVTGAAPLSAKVSQFFIGLGLPLLEGYGLTEAGPVVSGNHPADNVPGSVGKALPGVEVKVADDGELLVRSASVMQGYWQRAQDTKQVIDRDGWLHTGDLAEIRDSHIYIRGRRKEILVTSTGEKIAPAEMETTIMLDPLFDQAMVVGEGKPYLAAVLILNDALWPPFASALGVDPADEQAIQDERITHAVLQRLTRLLSTFPVYAQIHAVHLDRQAWTIENGLLTPTLKIKRHVLEERYSGQIKELYRGHAMIEP